MIIDPSGKTAIITGCTGGIGLAIAIGLLHRFANPEEVANLCVYTASPHRSALRDCPVEKDGVLGRML